MHLWGWGGGRRGLSCLLGSGRAREGNDGLCGWDLVCLWQACCLFLGVRAGGVGVERGSDSGLAFPPDHSLPPTGWWHGSCTGWRGPCRSRCSGGRRGSRWVLSWESGDPGWWQEGSWELGQGRDGCSVSLAWQREPSPLSLPV